MKRFKDILCVVEPERTSKLVLERAVSLAEHNQANLTVTVVAPSVTAGIGMPKGGPISTDLQTAIVDTRKQELETLIEPYRKQIRIETKVLVGIPFLEVIRKVLRHGHDLVIKMPEHQDWLDRLFGSDDMNLLRKCPCPVWLIKPQAPKTYRRILAAVDLDDDYPPDDMETRRGLNRQILEMASSLALAESADLHIGHAWDVVGESAMLHSGFMRRPEEEVIAYVNQVRQHHANNLDALMKEAVDYIGQDALNYLTPKTHLVKGLVHTEIPALVKQIDAELLVMGTVARTGIPGFVMGNTAETILNQIDCSVLAIKPPGFVTPVTLED